MKALTPFKPGEKVRVVYSVGEHSYHARGFFQAIDETGVLIRGRRGQADFIYIPADRLVRVESEKVAA